jgi:hypothetical protein
MPLRPDVLHDRRFWAALYAGAFGQVGEPPDAVDFCSQLAESEEAVLKWYHQFVGWNPGISDEPDGYSEDPATVALALADNVQLRVEFYLGDQYWLLRDADGVEAMLANIGGHWALPGLRWQEAVAIGDAAPADGGLAVLLLLPIVWLTSGDDIRAARSAAESAWAASHLADAAAAAALAELWAASVAGGRDYSWRRVSGQWVCDAGWSTRSGRRPVSESRSINRLITAATGAKPA